MHGRMTTQEVAEHVRRGRGHILHQIDLIKDFTSKGLPTEQAERLLHTFEDFQEQHETHLAQLQNQPQSSSKATLTVSSYSKQQIIEAKRLVRDGRKHVEQQRKRFRRLSAEGRPSENAERLAEAFETLLAAHENRLGNLRRDQTK